MKPYQVRSAGSVLAALCLAALLASAEARSAGAMGALAVDSAQGAGWGASWNHPSRASAARGARAKCGSQCTIVLYFWNACGAWAADQTPGSTVSGWGIAYSVAAARSEALRQCRKRGGSACQARVWACEAR